MNRPQRISQIVFGRQVAALPKEGEHEGNSVGMGGRRVLVRALLLVACLALLGQGMTPPAGAKDTDTHGAGQANVQVCEAAGGDANVTEWDYANGSQYVVVECNGGFLDGWDCYHSTATGTWQCSTAIIIPGDGGSRPVGGGPIMDNPVVAGGPTGGSPAGRLPALDHANLSGRDNHPGATDSRVHGKHNTHGRHQKHSGKHRKH